MTIKVLHFLIISVLTTTFLFPSSLLYSSYTFHYILQTLFALLILVSNTLLSKSDLQAGIPKKIIFFSIVVLVNSLITASYTLTITNELFSLRDGYRVVVILLLIMSVSSVSKKVNYNYLAKAFYIFSGIFVILSGVLALLWFVNRESVSFLDYFSLSDRGASDAFTIKSGYWRFTGLIGQPNFNAIATGIFVLYLLCCKTINIPLLRNTAILFSLPVFLFSSSRSLFAGILVYLLINLIIKTGNLLRTVSRNQNFFISKNGVVLFMILVSSVYVISVFSNDINYQLWRLSTSLNYVEDARFKIALYFLNFLAENPVNLMFGVYGDVNNYARYSFTDNEYLSLILKYGLLFFLLVAGCVISLYVRASKIEKYAQDPVIKNLANFVKRYFEFASIISFGSPIFTIPQLFIFPLIVMVLTFNQRLLIKHNRVMLWGE